MPAIASPDVSSELEDIGRKIEDQFEITLGDPDIVKELSAQLEQYLHHPPLSADVLILESLSRNLRIRAGEIAHRLFALLAKCVVECDSPWKILENMLSSRDEDLLPLASNLLHDCLEQHRISDEYPVLEFLAERCDEADSVFQRPHLLSILGRIIRSIPMSGNDSKLDHVTFLYRYSDHDSVRRLAARILDLDAQLPSPELSKMLLGTDAYAFLSPYLDYTRASHLDILRLAAAIEDGSPILTHLHRANHVCGPDALRQLIAELGWPALNQGIQVRRCIGVRVTGSLPLMLSPEEVVLFQSCGEAECVSDAFLVIAHGSTDSHIHSVPVGSERINRFRAYNLTHAELLDLILRVEPLSQVRVHEIMERMDRIVGDYLILFSAQDPECSTLWEVYDDLKQRINAEISTDPNGFQLSPELTRLVQMFEEPRSLATVHTVHGLKRYLHQQGLRLSFGLIETGQQLSRAVEVMAVGPDGARMRAKTIRYVDFEPDMSDTTTPGSLPYAVAVVAEGFGRQMLYGQKQFPSVDIFCYANEVHYYLAYRNHPAFVRVDYSPPLRGGMIDLEYYGVSNYEVGVHPNLNLDAIQIFFRELGFDVELTGTHIHARCDKESITDLGTLCKKVEALFRLAPYLMDIDWIIGSLDLPVEARRTVAEAWAESFVLWGVLPVHQLLTADRKGILETSVTDPSGTREIPWSGHDDYRDALTISPPLGFFERMSRMLEELELETLPLYVEDSRRPMGQVRLEERLFAPLRSAVKRGELVADAIGFRRLPPALYRSEHEVARFAEIISTGLDLMTQAVIIARIITPLERMLRFQTTGMIQGFEVQRAYLPLRGDHYVLYALRHVDGSIRMAFYSHDGTLCRQRAMETDEWTTNWQCDIQDISSDLRRNSYFVAGPELSISQARQEAADLLEELLTISTLTREMPISGERVVHGLSASPGRVTGPVRFGTAGRSPQDLEGCILLADTLRPEDNAYLYQCAGVMTTGGGVLSHAGLMAIQFGKPAMVIPGRWQRERDGSRSLLYEVEEFTEEITRQHGLHVSIRHNVRRREYTLHEGDLVVVDATRGLARILGQERDVVSLCDGLRLLTEESRDLSVTQDETERLHKRGRTIRARYMIEKILSRLSDAVVGRYAVHELLLGTLPSLPITVRCETEELLTILLRNPRVGDDARSCITWIVDELLRKYKASSSKAIARIPITSSLYEILIRRRDVQRLYRLLATTVGSLHECGIAGPATSIESVTSVDDLTGERLTELRDTLKREMTDSPETGISSSFNRHRSRRLHQLEDLLNMRHTEDHADFHTVQHLADRRSLGASSQQVRMSTEADLRDADLIGWKAANLAEIETLFGKDIVPTWFVVTDAAFREVLATPMSHLSPGRTARSGVDATLQESIAQILEKPNLDNRAKSHLIRSLWDGITLPGPLVGNLLDAYHQFPAQTEPENEPYVALRSSSREEDAEVAARAGEFETFLYVRGDQPLLEHLKRTWGSLWTERALHNRGVLGVDKVEPGGGVIVQRIVPARISGVVLTVNVAGEEPEEMVINAGYGLGEGVVSGKVAADQVTVFKEHVHGRSPMRFKYVVGDKREKVVFNERTGAGTMMATTLYHQRLRPALEYIELKELVSIATRFENTYGYPLDIEFAFEDSKLWILQVRPVATFATIFRETRESYPLHVSAKAAFEPNTQEGLQ